MKQRIRSVITLTILVAILAIVPWSVQATGSDVDITINTHPFTPEPFTNLIPLADRQELAVTPASGVDFCQAAQYCAGYQCGDQVIEPTDCGYYYPGVGYCWAGCAPTAAAVVLNYWNQNGYPGLADSMVQAIIDLHDHMQTPPCGGPTNYDNQIDGIRAYLSARGFAFEAEAITPSFDALKQEINGGRPVILSNGGHSFVCKGYDDTDQQLLLDMNYGDPGDSDRGASVWRSYSSLGIVHAIALRPPVDNCCCRTYSTSLSESSTLKLASAVFPLPAATYEPSVNPTHLSIPLITPAPSETAPVLADSLIARPEVIVQLNALRPASAHYVLVRSVFGTGGGPKTSASYAMRGTSGQTSGVDWRESSSYHLQSGYWGEEFWGPVPPGVLDRYIYLPIIIK
jgi:hypothetical protein